MESDVRFMNEVFRIVNGALRLDTERVRNYTAFLAEKLEKAGEASSAARLRKLLDDSDHELRPARLQAAKALPVDAESRFELLEHVPVHTFPDGPLVLADEQWKVVNEFLSVAKSYAQLEAEGVATALSFILYGPSGCGKSRIARYVSAELGLPLYIARLDGVISSFLGSTSKNIRALFDFASTRPCVLFLDEFDAIAKLRGDTQELGELKRVVNSFIQNLDSVARSSVVLAASNHPELLDAAVWRRFAYRLEVSRPNAAMRAELLTNYLPHDYFSAADRAMLVDLSEGFSGSDVEEVCLRLRRQSITTKSMPSLRDALSVLRNLSLGEGADRRPLAALHGDDDEALALALRARNSTLYSYASLGRLLGVSKATAQRLIARKQH